MRCPLCDSLNTEAVRSIEVEPLVAEWRRNFQMDVRSEFRGVSLFELKLCRDCSLQFFAPDSLTGSAQLYAELERFDWYYMPRKWEHDVALRDLRGARKMIEVGCGFGDFILLARREAGLSVEGVEQNAQAVREAERRGLHVRKATVEEAAKQSPGEYDAVCSFQVLEHVARPGEFLRACCRLLRPGGKLLLGLPNAESFLRHQFNPLDLPPHHMSKWSTKVLTALPQMLPLQLREIKLEPLADYHIDGYLEAYCSVLARGPLAYLPWPRVRGFLAAFLRRSGLRQWLRGQTVYACYERN